MARLNEAFDRTGLARVSSCSSSVSPWVLGPDWGLASGLEPDWAPASELRKELVGLLLQGGLEPVLLGPEGLPVSVLAWR